jgi:hypothetical protein
MKRIQHLFASSRTKFSTSIHSTANSFEELVDEHDAHTLTQLSMRLMPTTRHSVGMDSTDEPLRRRLSFSFHHGQQTQE